MEGVAVERRKIRLRMSLSNLMEFKKEVAMKTIEIKVTERTMRSRMDSA
jgi:hypothetical protein